MRPSYDAAPAQQTAGTPDKFVKSPASNGTVRRAWLSAGQIGWLQTGVSFLVAALLWEFTAALFDRQTDLVLSARLNRRARGGAGQAANCRSICGSASSNSLAASAWPWSSASGLGVAFAVGASCAISSSPGCHALRHPDHRAWAAVHPLARHRRLFEDRDRLPHRRVSDPHQHGNRADHHGAHLAGSGALVRRDQTPNLHENPHSRRLPFVIAGLRLSVARALVGVVVAELFGARAGLGFMILTSAQNFDTPALFVGVIIFAIAGVASVSLLKWIEQYFAAYRFQERNE